MIQTEEVKTYSRYIKHLSRREARSAMKELCDEFLDTMLGVMIQEEKYELCQVIKDLLDERKKMRQYGGK
ncbi:MAG: hypothetical protein EOP50_08255 [Sphingobacteriales bacterium]|nr:MAG: hypothetical protein EOP50_08255 [Sphingobacteriales bacterium]